MDLYLVLKVFSFHSVTLYHTGWLLTIQSLTRKTVRPVRGKSNAAILIILLEIAIRVNTMKRIIVRYPFARWIIPSTDALVALTSCRPLMKLVTARKIPTLANIIETFVNINILGPEYSRQHPSLDKIGDDPYIRQNQRHYDVDIRPCGIVD